MGLAAGQARLLTITGRKSDCEFESMRLSHQKIALSRQLADISNEYQNSLNQTKLVYDYYGTGDTSTQLSYGLLMYPSALNNYSPTIISDPLGRVVLDNKYAAAAAAAGIPQEGLGTLPSETLRNKFINALAGEDSGIISKEQAERITGLPYNQAAGFGGGATVAIMTNSGNITDFMEYIDNNSTAFNSSGTKDTYNDDNYCEDRKNAKDKNANAFINIVNGSDTSLDAVNNNNIAQLKLTDLLSDGDSQQYYLAYEGIKGEQTPVFGVALMQSFLTDPNGFIDWLNDEFSAMLDLGDGYTSKALEYAYNETMELVYPSTADSERLHNYWLTANLGKDTDDNTQHKKNDVKNFIDPISNQWCGKCSKDEKYQSKCVEDSKYCIGFSTVNSGKGGGDDGNDHATAGINLNNIAKAYLTFFADYMNGVSKTNSKGEEIFYVSKGGLENKGDWTKDESIRLATQDFVFQYTWRIGTDASSDDLGQASFYDALFNQICANGWTKNDEINKNDYLQQMLQNGMMFVSTMKDDNYFYQTNYAIDTYIKEIADESGIAYAESKYNTEKAKLNAKEETLDLKLKNLDTEISSLTTEYETVKSAITKQIDKSFKRYSA